MRYLGWLINKDLSKDEIATSAKAWNARNRPPLTAKEVVVTVDSCYGLYAKNVSIKTLTKDNNVLIEIKTCSQLEQQNGPCSTETPSVSLGAWTLEEAVDPLAFCGKKRRIIRHGRKYISVSFFCGRWNCPRCSAYFRQRWVAHITNITKGQELYVLRCDQKDWGRIRRSINRLKADYVKMTNADELTIILNRPIKGTGALPDGNMVEFLEAAIPKQADACPISTSRGWEQQKDTKHDTEYKLVTNSWLPTYDQMEIAQTLGATSRHYGRWVSPSDIGEKEWENQFVRAIRNREYQITKLPPEKSKAMVKLLRKHYVIDDIYQEPDEGGFEERCLVGTF